jgi:hypothetical protein
MQRLASSPWNNTASSPFPIAIARRRQPMSRCAAPMSASPLAHTLME